MAELAAKDISSRAALFRTTLFSEFEVLRARVYTHVCTHDVYTLVCTHDVRAHVRTHVPTCLHGCRCATARRAAIDVEGELMPLNAGRYISAALLLYRHR